MAALPDLYAHEPEPPDVIRPGNEFWETGETSEQYSQRVIVAQINILKTTRQTIQDMLDNGEITQADFYQLTAEIDQNLAEVRGYNNEGEVQSIVDTTQETRLNVSTNAGVQDTEMFNYKIVKQVRDEMGSITTENYDEFVTKLQDRARETGSTFSYELSDLQIKANEKAAKYIEHLSNSKNVTDLNLAINDLRKIPENERTLEVNQAIDTLVARRDTLIVHEILDGNQLSPTKTIEQLERLLSEGTLEDPAQITQAELRLAILKQQVNDQDMLGGKVIKFDFNRLLSNAVPNAA